MIDKIHKIERKTIRPKPTMNAMGFQIREMAKITVVMILPIKDTPFLSASRILPRRTLDPNLALDPSPNLPNFFF